MDIPQYAWIPLNTEPIGLLINFKASCVKGQAQILTPLILADLPQKASAKVSGVPEIISGHLPGAFKPTTLVV